MRVQDGVGMARSNDVTPSHKGSTNCLLCVFAFSRETLVGKSCRCLVLSGEREVAGAHEEFVDGPRGAAAFVNSLHEQALPT